MLESCVSNERLTIVLSQVGFLRKKTMPALPREIAAFFYLKISVKSLAC